MDFLKIYTEEDCVKIKEHHFRPFHKTYKWLSLTLTLGNLFPEPESERFRLFCIIFLQVVGIPLIASSTIEMVTFWAERDMYNFIGYSTLIGPFLLAFLKMYLMYYKRVQAKEILDEINRDHECFNSLPRKHQDAAFLGIKTSIRNVERIWSPITSFGIMFFPVLAFILTLYSYAFDDKPKKTTPLSNDPKEMSRFPFFEVLFMYETVCCLICLLNYTAYDGFFGVATNHACLKIKLCCLKLNDAFQCDDPEEIYKGVLEFIEDQKKMYKFVDMIRNVFSVWLGVILVSTMIQLGSLLFHAAAGYGVDLRHAVFCVACVFHIFLPYENAGTLTLTSTEMATMIYCSGWERARERRVRRMLPFMIARAQVPNYITAFNLFIFDMELFVKIMRTSYSIFTLMRS